MLHTVEAAADQPVDHTRPPRFGWLRRHPLLAFFTWFFTVGQAFAFAPLMLHTRIPHQVFIIGATLFGLLLPHLAITRLVDGPEALRRTLRSFVDWRHGLRWYAFAALAAPAVSVGLSLLLFGAPAHVALSTLAGVVVVQFALNMVPNNWAEEGTWSGFVQPRLQKRHGAVLGAVLAAMLFTAQHISLMFGGSLVTGALLLTFLLLVSIPYRFVTGFLWNRTGSMFLAGVLHAAGNTAATGSGFGRGGVLVHLYPNVPVISMVHLVAFAVIGLLVLAFTRGRLGLRTSATAKEKTNA